MLSWCLSIIDFQYFNISSWFSILYAQFRMILNCSQVLDFQHFSKMYLYPYVSNCLSINTLTIFSVFHNITFVIIVTYWFSVDLQVLTYHRNFASSSLWYWYFLSGRGRGRGTTGSGSRTCCGLDGSRTLYRMKFFDKYDRRVARRLFCDGTTL